MFWLIGSILSSLILFVGYDILKLIADYFELLQNLSIYQDHHFFLRVAFEGTVVTAFLALVWSYRYLLVGSFPLRHPTHDLSLYPIALAALLVALIPPVRSYAVVLGSHGRILPLLVIPIILSLAIIRIAVPSGRGFHRSASTCTAGMTFLWMGILIPIVFRLLHIASSPVIPPPEVQNRLLNVTMPSALSLGWFGSLTLVVPIGLALVGQSRLWRKIAIFSSLWSLTAISYSLYGLLSITSRFITTIPNNLSLPLSFWLSKIIGICIPLLALSFLIRPRQLEHFGLEPRRSGYFPSINKAFKLTPKKLIRSALIIMGLYLLATGQIAYLFEKGGNPIAKNTIESYSLEFLSDQIKTLQPPIRNNAENMITVLGVSNDRLGNVWWDKTGRPIPRPRHMPPASPNTLPEPSSFTHHILVRIVDSIPTPFTIEISLVTKGGIRPLVQTIDDRHRLLTFSVPKSTSGIQGYFSLTPSRNMPVAQGRTRKEQQLSSTLKFHWKDDSHDAQQVMEWMTEAEWHFEMWAHSITRSRSSYSDKVQRVGDHITASFREEIGPYSNFTLFARPTYRITISGIALSPVEQ